MNKYLLILLSSIICIETVHAADGTITFKGKVLDSTCKVNNGGGANLTVSLPNVSLSSLNNAGQVAGRTAFKIILSGCSATQVTAFFEPGATVNSNTGRLINSVTTGTSAKNIDIQLLNSKGQQIMLNAFGSDGTQTNTEWQSASSASTSTELSYAAEYYATAAVTAGEVNTSVQYTLIYK
ncbi:major type 1 subunit fimbrin (pilin) [Acinetobacter calcoaceticus]|uniref:Major type 1 subunit fimbrin (Pilin) n=1 Tax=Acinetobacter calcoaceticus TaxID=471 RepID=A0A4R1XHL6_ACICA|nr:major type 1 subunit fimbrin (pilin) [Acinetobacter calcoaceticus]